MSAERDRRRGRPSGTLVICFHLPSAEALGYYRSPPLTRCVAQGRLPGAIPYLGNHSSFTPSATSMASAPKAALYSRCFQ